MKRPQVVLAISALNVAIIALASLAIGAAAQAPELPRPDFRAQQSAWQSPAGADVLPQWHEVSLSPTKRPAVETTTTTTTVVEKEPTEAELRAELEARLAREVKLLRIMYAEGAPQLCFAKVRVGSREIVIASNGAFYASVAPALVKALPEWLAEAKVLEISADGVTISVPSRKPELRFEFTLVLNGTGLVTVLPRG